MGIVVIMYHLIYVIIFIALPMTYIISKLALDDWSIYCLSFAMAAVLVMFARIADHVDHE